MNNPLSTEASLSGACETISSTTSLMAVIFEASSLVGSSGDNAIRLNDIVTLPLLIDFKVALKTISLVESLWLPNIEPYYSII